MLKKLVFLSSLLLSSYASAGIIASYDASASIEASTNFESLFDIEIILDDSDDSASGSGDGASSSNYSDTGAVASVEANGSIDPDAGTAESYAFMEGVIEITFIGTDTSVISVDDPLEILFSFNYFAEIFTDTAGESASAYSLIELELANSVELFEEELFSDDTGPGTFSGGGAAGTATETFDSVSIGEVFSYFFVIDVNGTAEANRQTTPPDPTGVPEPSSILLLALGLVAVVRRKLS